MTVGERIAARRKQLNMTQEELAKKMGYKSKSSINKIELEWANVPLSKLEKVAAALDCDPSYLMGWDEQSEEAPGLVREPYENWVEADMRLLKWFRSLPPEKQRAILIAQDAPEDLF